MIPYEKNKILTLLEVNIHSNFPAVCQLDCEKFHHLLQGTKKFLLSSALEKIKMDVTVELKEK